MGKTKFKRERWALGTDYRYRCTTCGEIKKPSHFGKQKRAKWGLNPQCAVCVNNKRQESKTPEIREHLRKKSRDAARKKATAARAADKKYENWLWRSEQGLKVEVGKPGWSKHSDCCLQCGTFFHPHHGKGLCHKCYARDYQGSPHHAFHRGGRWARLFDRCVQCGKNDRRHAARGICVGCRWLNEKPGPQNPDCKQCGAKIPITKYASKRKYCSEKCASKWYRERRKEREAKEILVVDQEHLVTVECHSGQAILPLAM